MVFGQVGRQRLRNIAMFHDTRAADLSLIAALRGRFERLDG